MMLVPPDEFWKLVILGPSEESIERHETRLVNMIVLNGQTWICTILRGSISLELGITKPAYHLLAFCSRSFNLKKQTVLTR